MVTVMPVMVIVSVIIEKANLHNALRGHLSRKQQCEYQSFENFILFEKKSIFAHEGKNTSYTGENYQKNQLLRYTLERFLGQTNKINKIFV